MKYTCEINIDLNRADVIKKLDSTENLKHWQRGLISADHISGTPGQEGAKMKFNYQMGKRKIEMVETILKNNFPSEFYASYDSKGVHNVQENYFEELPDGKTKWISKSEFKFDGFMMKTMAFLMPGAFKKQSMSFLNAFKEFAEKGTSVNQS